VWCGLHSSAAAAASIFECLFIYFLKILMMMIHTWLIDAQVCATESCVRRIFLAQSRSLHSTICGEFAYAVRARPRMYIQTWPLVLPAAANGLAECARLDAHLVGPGAPPKPVRAAFCPRDHVDRTQHFVAASLPQWVARRSVQSL
jgi:hypothetical protein